MAPRAVRLEWPRRVAAEYAVCLLAEDFAQRLTRFGAPAELVQGALQMALDELEHARLARQVCDEAGVRGPVAFDLDTYGVDAAPDPACHIAAVAVPNLCLGETLALRIVHRLRANATVGVARGALDRVVADEPRHAALGWTTLDWLLDLPDGRGVRESIERELPRWAAALRGSYAGAYVEPHLAALGPADTAWGLASPELHRAVFEETVERDWAPRLARRGFALA